MENRLGMNCPLGYILAMEGTDPILSPKQVVGWWEQGLRVASVCHFGLGVYSNGTGREGGLTERGPDLLKAMAEVGMILDLHIRQTKLSGRLWICIQGSCWPVNNCRALVPGCRQFSDDQIRAILDRDGVIGVALDIWMLYPDFVERVTPNTV